MIEKYMNGTILPERKQMEERMFNANLIDKFLAENPQLRLAKPGSPGPDSLPSTKIPLDAAPGTSVSKSK